jgi:hypothetical protein
LTRGATGIAAARLAVMLVGIALAIVLLGAIAFTVGGAERIIVLALLTPILVFTILVVWRCIGAANEISARRAASSAEMRRQEIFGRLAYPSLPAWEERINRSLILPTGRNLLVVNSQTIDTAEGQQRMRMLGDLLARPQPPDTILPAPRRATLALITNTGDVHSWDLTALFERIDAGDDAASEELLELELHVQDQALRAVE